MKGIENDFVTTDSRTCRKSCINEYGNFCATIDFERGTCCNWKKNNCGKYGGFCANHIAEENRFNGLEYWVCPRERVCGDMTQIA